MKLHADSIMAEYRAAGAWGTSTLLTSLEEAVRNRPDGLALVDPPDRDELVGTPARTLTWREVAVAADRIAAGLRSRGVIKDDVVMVQLPNVRELPLLYLAIARAGAIIAPLPMQWRQREIAYIADLTRTSMFISTTFKGTDHLELAAGAHPFAQLVGLDELFAMAAVDVDRDELDGIEVAASDVFSICWTSGTEAEPKGCPLTHDNWLFQAGAIRRVTDLRDGDRLLCTAPLVNMTGVGAMLVPWLLTAGTLLLHHPLNMPELLRQLTEEDVQFTILVPALLNMLAKLPEDGPDLSTVRTIITGSAPPSAWSLAEFKRRWNIEITNLWGQNEGTVLASGQADVPDLEARADVFPWWGRGRWPSGMEHVSARILDDDAIPVTDPGAVGELVYRGPNVFPGYFERPDLNAELFVDGYLRTGDLFRIVDERHVAFFDRKKDIIIRGGFNISAAEVENLALGHPAVADAAAVAVPDDVLGERVCLCVAVPEGVPAPALSEICEFMGAAGLGRYKLPERLEVVDAIPRNPVGKILKRELRDRLRTGRAPADPLAAGRR